MDSFKIKDKYNTHDLQLLMDLLRDPEHGCSWDKVQTSKSIERCMLEEAYEAVQAIDDDDPVALQEELGDLLFQVAFHAKINKEQNRFDYDDVVDGVVKKMVFRHPHLFGGESMSWEENKQREKGYKSAAHKCELVPRALPALMRGKKVLRKAKDAGFEPQNMAQIRQNLKIFLDNEMQNCNNNKVGFGTVVLALTSLADELGIDLEQETNTAIDCCIAQVKDWETRENK